MAEYQPVRLDRARQQCSHARLPSMIRMGPAGTPSGGRWKTHAAFGRVTKTGNSACRAGIVMGRIHGLHDTGLALNENNNAP
jgi:hypothetical protein